MFNRYMRMIVAGLTCVVLLAGMSRVHSQGGPLPPEPDAGVIAQLLRTAPGREFVALKVPTAALDAVSGNLRAAVSQLVDVDKTTTLLRGNSSYARSIVPVKGAANAKLQADTQTPDDNKPAKILGVITTPEGTAVIMVTLGGPGGKADGIRFYTASGAPLAETTNVGLVSRVLKGDGTGKPSVADQGVLISARETCFTVGLDQVCYTKEDAQSDDASVSAVQEALQALSARYTVGVEFDLDGSLSELIGGNNRKTCSDNLTRTNNLKQNNGVVKDCSVNVAFTAATTLQDGQPIGVFRVLKDAEFAAYTLDGKKARYVTAGSYYVLNVTPAALRSKPGSMGVLFLVNADGQNHFLVLSRVSEGFGTTGDQGAGKVGQAAIKDGYINGQDF